jgi:hypothetical protein
MPTPLRLLGLHVNSLHRLMRELELKSILADAGYSSAVSATRNRR